ncbi:FecR family protein [Pedobacter sp. KACC 23697]|uniref:FecR domain-containing protein n=1 Tax=Pedobacter sp. KACC 23697 TaxID=3149230 RepID=A0AAU7K8J4_9SPHI
MTEDQTKYTQELLNRYNAGNCTAEEEILIETWFNAYANTIDNVEQQEDMELIGQEIWAKLPATHVSIKRKLWPRFAAAAAVILVLIGFFKLYERNSNQELQLVQNKKEQIAPGTFGATLTLANGKQIRLSQLKNGVFAEEAGVKITKTAKGELVYQVKDETSNALQTNTLTTAKGETFKVELPDGSSVWLNAASSLTYTTNLASAAIRKVKLSGEAYFKVAHDQEHPFIVTTLGHDIKVLGTEFNVSSYENDDAEITTLVQGKISMNTYRDKVILTPGEKGTVRNGSIEKATANIEAATGWKNNEFVFASQDIRSIMKLIARWYDVNIIYEGEIPSEKISGSISRFADIHSVLNILQATGTVKIKTAGSRVVVSAL